MGDTQCGVPGLEPGKKYKFRVKAVNSEGESEPLANDNEILAKDPYGQYTGRVKRVSCCTVVDISKAGQ